MTRFYGGLHIGENLGGYQYKYSISVSGQRGLKEFQYDQVFMEDSTREDLGGYQCKYSISVSGQRGVKVFQYDQVFMEDSTQEKILEDTNISTVYLCQVREV